MMRVWARPRFYQFGLASPSGLPVPCLDNWRLLFVRISLDFSARSLGATVLDFNWTSCVWSGLPVSQKNIFIVVLRFYQRTVHWGVYTRFFFYRHCIFFKNKIAIAVYIKNRSFVCIGKWQISCLIFFNFHTTKFNKFTKYCMFMPILRGGNQLDSRDLSHKHWAFKKQAPGDTAKDEKRSGANK